MLLNDGVHNRLSKHRLINLIVTMSSVSNQVNNNILVPGGAPFGGDVGHQHHGLGIVGVDVEDGSVDDSTDVGTVGGGSGVSGVSGEANLVVSNNVNGSLKEKFFLFIF